VPSILIHTAIDSGRTGIPLPILDEETDKTQLKNFFSKACGNEKGFSIFDI
jgi:hypothetical protein